MIIARLTVLLCAALAACASTPLYGNFLEHTSVRAQTFFALDTAAQLRRAYSPAALSLVVPSARDPFGLALVARLRRQGFAVADEGVAAPPHALTVRYVVDAIGDQLYRITLTVRRTRDDALITRMSRAYGQQDGMVRAAGAWTRQTAAEEGPAWTTN
jgi:hypothetical protein